MTTKSANYINHITLLLDASSSMTRYRHDLVKVADAQITHLAERSKFHDQETRITVYTFTHDGMGANIPCLIYDKDVLRMPSISGLYHPNGWTPLCDAITQAIADMKLVSEKYGDHSHLLYVLTDGYENRSRQQNRTGLQGLIRSLPDNWTVAAFAPDVMSKTELIKYGFHKDNIKVWDVNEGVEEVGAAMAYTTDMYMTARAQGTRSTTSLFSMAAPAASDVKATMTPMTKGSFWVENVTTEEVAKVDNGRIDQIMQLKTGKPYSPDGRTFYRMDKRERIQPGKKIAIVDKQGNAYTGSAARTLLGLPPEGSTEVRVSPGRWTEYEVYVQSTSNNRKLFPGTRVLVMR